MIKIQITDVCREFDIKNNFIIDILVRKFGGYEISEKPEFLFFSSRGTEHNKYEDCVKIFLANEGVTPDFNFCDYAIGYDEMQFGERYFKWPHCMTYWESNSNISDMTALEEYIVGIIEKGNSPYEKDALGLAKKMSIPNLSTKELVRELFVKVLYRLRKNK